MDVVHLHLVLVHLPVIGLPLALGVWTLATRRGERFWQTGGAWLWLFCAAAAAGAYLSGGAAFERLRAAAGEAGWEAQALAETHGLTGRAALLATVLSALALLQIPLQRRQGQDPGRALHLLALILGLAACALLFLTAWQGGLAGHPELR
ncbi:MAG: hypothetical protein Q8O14_01250 [bacterium]|jgi:uncharacterized membrane protein|nr:hypothetical protein [bacterium]